jgi:A/G-specific adenine glycosylase
MTNDSDSTNHESRITNHGCSASHEFSSRIIAWQRRHGRHDLPWQNTRDPYRIWLSEIMLQQTQVAAVVPYFQRFIARFPDAAALAAASEDEVLALWSGLGYYARARNLHRAARLIMQRHGGSFPRELPQVAALPGIGPSTAAAICTFAYAARHAILDGNVKRVLARQFGIAGYPGHRDVEQALWARSRALVPEEDVAPYTQGMMDLGATVCTRGAPRCQRCPVADTCVAFREARTMELPAPRPVRALPRRATAMLVLRHAGELLLERRPAPGLWGGLWCFPEVSAERVLQECAARFGADIEVEGRLGEIDHGFTHFRLRITPLLARLQRAPAMHEPGKVWLTPEDALRAAIPAPVRKILEALSAGPLAG